MTRAIAAIAAALAAAGCTPTLDELATAPAPTPHHAHPRRHRRHRRHRRRRPDPPPMREAIASWYDYGGGTTASGREYPYGFASLLFGSAWGTRVLFCHGARCHDGQLDDHGPYVGGRSFDFTLALRDALGCPDLCDVRWRLDP
jgi:hypothetical protein